MLNSIVGLLGSGAGGGGTAFESIATATGTGSSAVITFSSIPSTYVALQVRIMARDTGAATVRSITYTANNDTATNYARHSLTGDGATPAAAGVITQSSMGTITIPGASAAAGIDGVAIIDIQDYASTTKTKTFRQFNGYDANGSGSIRIASNLWTGTAAINRLDFTTSTGFDTSCIIALYGIKGA